ncbi:TPA: hypothetical protein ACW72W_003838 [Aeromonas veronii]
MSKLDLWEQPIKSTGENGIFKKQDWIKEADGKIISAKLLRNCAKNAQLKFENLTRDSNGNIIRASSQETFELLDEKAAANKASFLLLGYAIELLLKSSIVSLLISAPKKILDKKMKSYSHGLINITNDLRLSLSRDERSLLVELEKFIVEEARYPLKSYSPAEYCEDLNKVNQRFSDHSKFNLGVELFTRLRAVMMDIDGTPGEPKFYNHMGMEDNGFIIFRAGGSLPAVIIIKFCDSQIRNGLNNLNHVRRLLLKKNEHDMTIYSRLMEKTWMNAIFFVVDEKKGLKKVEYDYAGTPT